MSAQTRAEFDSMGQMEVPADSYFGAQTARAVENFPISNLRFQRPFIRALGLIKKHAARANRDLGILPWQIAQPIEAAAGEVVEGRWDHQFVVDVFQTGSGTSTNMNANEVIANRALELMGKSRGTKHVHPNDHVNLGQSSNDVIPSAIHISAAAQIEVHLIPSLMELGNVLSVKAVEFNDVIKIGRTHLQDATPIRLGQEFGGYAAQVEHSVARVRETLPHLRQLALGGTAVGTGINTHPDFAKRSIASMSDELGMQFSEAPNHFAAQSAIDALVALSAALRGLTLTLVKVANDIRWLASGPRCGLGEIDLPATQPGSSIMPGKVNPVMTEMLIQVAARVIGLDATVAFSASCGAFELNTMLPIVAHSLLESIDLLGNGAHVFSTRCVRGIQPNRVRCATYVEQSLAMGTVLAPVIGYDAAARIAKVAYEQGRTVREVAREISGLDEAKLSELLDPAEQSRGKNLPSMPHERS